MALQLETLNSRVFRTDKLRELARRVRLREDATKTTLDMRATISAFIRGCGFPRFRYRPVRRPREYLVLIECVSNADTFCLMTTDRVDLLKPDAADRGSPGAAVLVERANVSSGHRQDRGLGRPLFER